MYLSRKGVIFTIDALLAFMIILSLYILTINIDTTPLVLSSNYEELHYQAEDAAQLLSLSKGTQLPESTKQEILSSTNITAQNLDESLLDIIGRLWAEGHSTLAENVTYGYLSSVFPQDINFEFSITSEDITYLIASRGDLDLSEHVTSASRIVSGYKTNTTGRGYVARLNIESIHSQLFTDYIYFGGYVGEGNITSYIDLPQDFDSLINITMELNVYENFRLSLNDQPAGIYYNGSMGGGYMRSDKWTLNNSYYNYIQPGRNNISINFISDNFGYIAGGYIALTYNVSNIALADTSANNTVSDVLYLPGITGLINLYDSFYIPGNLTELNISLSILNNYTLYVKIADQEVYSTNNTGIHIIDNSTISQFFESYNTNLSLKTIPIRIGMRNVTGLSQGSDVVLVTDVSGSMGFNWPWSTDDDDNGTDRMSLAIKLDKNFVNTILGNDGQMVGLVSYESSTDSVISLTDDQTTLDNEIDGYNASGGTCICCGINSAGNLLTPDITYDRLITAGDTWNYTNIAPAPDGLDYNWSDYNYSLESMWSTGNAVLGTDNISGILINTIIDPSSNPNESYMDLWDGYMETPQFNGTTFFCGFNSTDNTPELSGSNDGWDWWRDYVGDSTSDHSRFGDPEGITDYDTNTGSGVYRYDGLSDRTQLEVIIGDDGNSPDNVIDSAAFGVEFYIPQYAIDIINNNGSANYSFLWYADDLDDDLEEGAWIKARFGNSTDMNWLGSDLDHGADAIFEDSSNEVWALVDEHKKGWDGYYYGTFSENISEYINGSGWYYIDFGAKVDWADSDSNGKGSNEGLGAYFRNISFVVSNATDYFVADLWEKNCSPSSSSECVTFSALNYTANTFGLSGAQDGWDWADNPFTDYNNMPESFTIHGDPNGASDQITAGSISVKIGGFDTGYSEYIASGAWGIDFNITTQQYDMISSGAELHIGFDWTVDDEDNDLEEFAWIKARIDYNSTSNYLGRNLDNMSDETNEVWASSTSPSSGFAPDPNSGHFSQDITEYVAGSGKYYLSLGGIVDWVNRSGTKSDNEGIEILFDNICLKLVNSSGTDTYYFRKHFNITNMTEMKLLLNLLADGYANVYINGNLVHEQSHDDTPAKYWNSEEIVIRTSNLVIGDNVIAVELVNPNVSAKFDLELILTDLRNKFIIVMSDGAATTSCAAQSTGSSSVDAIKAACDLHRDYGVIIHAIGFGSESDAFTMRGIADCGRGDYYLSNDAQQLILIYESIANALVRYDSQVATLTGDFSNIILYPISNISYSYIQESSENYGNITLDMESGLFSSFSGDDIDMPFKRGQLMVPNNTHVSQAKVISYSSEWWTDEINISSDITSNGSVIYSLYDYNSLYQSLGDPFIIDIPLQYISSGKYNYVNVRTGLDPNNPKGGSPDNKIIYKLKVRSYVDYGEVFTESEGCIWEVEFYDATTTNITVPSDYSGSDLCYYTNSSQTLTTDDAYIDAAYRLFETLDNNMDHRLDVVLISDNINFRPSFISDIPWLWGPIVTTLSIGD